MKLSWQFESPPDEALRGAVTIGNFDGVHRGHAILLRRLRAMADRLGGPAVALTFDPHPVAVLRPGAEPKRLTWIQRRAELLGRAGVDQVIVLRTDVPLLELSAAEFFWKVVRGSLQAAGMVEGPNFFFGRGREGNIERLGSLCREAGIPLEIVPSAETQGEMISSTRLRDLVAAGQIETANALLTAPYAIRGRVTRGAGRGADLGFPTANLTDIAVLIPGPGVYAALVEWEGQRYAAAAHIGPNPTFGETRHKVELYLLDFSGDLYGHWLQVDFIGRVRDIARFASPEELRGQLVHDVDEVRRRLGAFSNQLRAAIDDG